MKNNLEELGEVRVQTLETGEFHRGTLFSLRKNWTLLLEASTKLAPDSDEIRVFCNMVPAGRRDAFKRAQFYEYPWTCGELRHDDFSRCVKIKCQQPGAYSYYFLVGAEQKPAGGASFVVEPDMRLSNGESIDLDGLQIQTYLSKLLGGLEEWKKRLEVAKQSGYNMIHFTPVSELSGESNSAYCIRNHFKLIGEANLNGKFTVENLSEIVDFMYNEWQVFSICDLVYNHMANDADFLKECPEATYNMVNSPYLIPAYVLDRVFSHATRDIAKGLYESRGISSDKADLSNIDSLRQILRWEQIPKCKFSEFFMLDVPVVMDQIKQLANSPEAKSLTDKSLNELWQMLSIVQDEAHRRMKSSIDFDVVRSIISLELRQSSLDNILSKFQSHLERLNDQVRSQTERYLDEAVENVLANFRYHFFAEDGPRWQQVTVAQPLVTEYFYFPFEDTGKVESDELLAYDTIEGAKIQAHNGWVMTDNPLENFAAKGTMTYFRRHLIAWGDSVKLRFGSGPEDNPKLWNYMAEYTKMTAKIFHGVRLDNCHSTPIHVAQYMLDVGRSVRPDLYVTAELFTNNERTDNQFVAELGITSLIRESLNAWNANELGRLVHRFGGEAVGSFFQQSTRPLREAVAHASFFDVTHDNESLIKKRCVLDALPSSSLVLMSNCAVGSTRGFDELVPHHIHVVNETRPYSVWDQSTHDCFVSFDSGIIKAKSILNKLHYDMSLKGFSQIYIDQFDEETTVVTRHNPHNHESYVLIARTAFSSPSHHSSPSLHKPLQIPSLINDRLVLEAYTCKSDKGSDFARSEKFVNGIENYCVKLTENGAIAESRFIDRIEYDGQMSHVHFKFFPAGAVAVFKVSLNQKSEDSLPYIKQAVNELKNCFVNDTDSKVEIDRIMSRLNFDELNILLYRCSTEETDEQIESDVYTVPDYGPLVYCGLQGFMNVLERERVKNNLGHPMFQNLRQGDWMMNYIADRLTKYAHKSGEKRATLQALASWLQRLFAAVSNLPRFLIPAYFDLIITGLYEKALERTFTLMSQSSKLNNKNVNFNIAAGSSFLKSLALGSVLFNGHLGSALLPNTVLEADGLMLSLSAGLPHFANSYMRNWGRDTFISVRGLLLLTNRFNDAKNLILSYASTLRHGLIPNLLGEGKMARFNCRDAAWWWLNSLKEYTLMAPNGFDILDSQLVRLYPSDEAENPSDVDLKEKRGMIVRLRDLVQETMQVHVTGLKFRERNAGKQIDEHMLDEGFNNQIGVDLETGFVYGGNKLNCGTWMDKLGSSMEAGNKGLPATPRDGSAVELVGLCRSVLDWLILANSKSKYAHSGVTVTNRDMSKSTLTWTEWASRIDANFEKYFWVGEDSCESEHINKRCIYKDTLNSSAPWTDYQLRPNFLIALTVAPQMVNPEHARKALEMCTMYLVDEPDSVGIKTLDASDFNYCGYYDNSNRSTDAKVAHGFNYHQGPEWLWPIGYFLRAHLYYNSSNVAQKKKETMHLVKNHLAKLCERLNATDWKSLPELTNRNGQECFFSCDAQAWSVATTLEVFYDLCQLD